MPTKRAVLAELTRAVLRAGLDRYELAIDDRRVKAQLVDALARSRKSRLDEMVLRLSRNRVKELCRVFGLDDSGRKKADLVARLVRLAAASSGSVSPNVASGGKVLFIDASGEFEEGSNQNRLRDQDVANISRTFHACADVETYARVVPLDEIERNDWSLNISRYVDTSEEEERIDVAEAAQKPRELK